MRRTANWDFTQCFDWPAHLIWAVYQHEFNRNLAVLNGVNPKAPFFDEPKKIEEWLVDQWSGNEDHCSPQNKLVIRIPNGRDLSLLKDFYHIETFGISLPDVLDPKNDSSFLKAFQKHLSAIRKKKGKGKPGRSVSIRSKLADLSAYRLKDAGYSWGDLAATKWWGQYSSKLKWQSGSYHSRSQGRVRSRGEDRWWRSCNAHQKTLKLSR